MKGRNYDNIIEKEEEFKTYIKNYELEMYKLRYQHQSIVKGKEYLNYINNTPKTADEQNILNKELKLAKESKAETVLQKSKELNFLGSK